MAKFDYYFGIASYNRKDRQPMLKLLNKWGYPKEQILLAVQCEKDFKDYEPLYGHMATILYREGRNVSDNKNTILEYMTEHLDNAKVVILSDKVRGINWMDKKKKTHAVETKEQMDKLVQMAYELTRQIGGRVWGCYTLDNTFYMNNTITTNMQVLGCFMGIVDPSEQKFDPQQPLTEDFEFILHHISRGNQTVRFNDVFLTATLHTHGGSYELWHAKGDAVKERCNNRIMRMYPTLVKPHATRKNEFRFVGPRMTLPISITDYL